LRTEYEQYKAEHECKKEKKQKDIDIVDGLVAGALVVLALLGIIIKKRQSFALLSEENEDNLVQYEFQDTLARHVCYDNN